MVQVVLVIVAVTLSPLLGLALLLWLAHLEDTLPRDVQRASRKPAPEPILAMPVRATATPAVPEQRAAPEAELAPSPAV